VQNSQWENLSWAVISLRSRWGNHKTFENFQRPRTLWFFFFLNFRKKNIGTGGSLITPMKLPYLSLPSW
jgi:hypothetical protein